MTCTPTRGRRGPRVALAVLAALAVNACTDLSPNLSPSDGFGLSLDGALSPATPAAAGAGPGSVWWRRIGAPSAEPAANAQSGFVSGDVLFADADPYARLLRRDGGPWSFTKETHDANRVGRGDGPGGRALYAYAVNDTDPVSKASAVYGELDLRAGDAIEVSACVWAPGGANLSDVFIMDLECADCWPAGASAPDPSPGVRIHLKDPQGYPVLERAKIGYGRDSLRPPPARQGGLARDVWTRVTWRLELGGRGDDGWAQIWLDQDLIVEGRTQTLPEPDAFAEDGVRLRNIKVDYLELGVTANASSAPLTLGFRDVSISRLGPGQADRTPSPCAP